LVRISRKRTNGVGKKEEGEEGEEGEEAEEREEREEAEAAEEREEGRGKKEELINHKGTEGTEEE
jgi:hypothetical protein